MMKTKEPETCAHCKESSRIMDERVIWCGEISGLMASDQHCDKFKRKKPIKGSDDESSSI